MNRLKRAMATAGAVVVMLGGAVLVDPEPALASSGMSCTVDIGSRTAWFYCDGSQNVTNPWIKVGCVALWPWSPVSWTYKGTMYAPWSFSESLTCPIPTVAYNPEWGPK